MVGFIFGFAHIIGLYMVILGLMLNFGKDGVAPTCTGVTLMNRGVALTLLHDAVGAL